MFLFKQRFLFVIKTKTNLKSKIVLLGIIQKKNAKILKKTSK